jgi:hypothetical protein
MQLLASIRIGFVSVIWFEIIKWIKRIQPKRGNTFLK